MARFRITYWPGSGDVTPALTGEQIKAQFPERTIEITAANRNEAVRLSRSIAISSDGCLVEEIEGTKNSTITNVGNDLCSVCSRGSDNIAKIANCHTGDTLVRICFACVGLVAATLTDRQERSA